MVKVEPGASERDFTRGGAAGTRKVDVDADELYCGGDCGDVASGENRATLGGGDTAPARPCPAKNEFGDTSDERDAGRGAKIIDVDVGEEYGISLELSSKVKIYRHTN